MRQAALTTTSLLHVSVNGVGQSLNPSTGISSFVMNPVLKVLTHETGVLHNI